MTITSVGKGVETLVPRMLLLGSKVMQPLCKTVWQLITELNTGLLYCIRVQTRGPPKEGFVMGSRSQGAQKILKKTEDVLTPTSLNWGMGCMEQGH